jgi:DNA-binding transcriptional regulator/RsmH inhibitor MraZ
MVRKAMRANLLKAKKKKPRPISFVGRYEVTVLTDRRIILPVNVIRQLKDHNAKKILPGKLPGSKAIVLCPENLWNHWVKKLKKSFPCLKTYNGARTFLVPWQPVGWDTKGRITLPRRAREHAGIKADETVIIMGMDYCFELWPEKEFNKIIQECEATLRKSVQPSLPIETVFYPAKDRKSH